MLGYRDGSLPRKHLEQWNVGRVRANYVLGIFLVIDHSVWAIPMKGYGPSPQGAWVVRRCDNMQAVQRQTQLQRLPLLYSQSLLCFSFMVLINLHRYLCVCIWVLSLSPIRVAGLQQYLFCSQFQSQHIAQGLAFMRCPTKNLVCNLANQTLNEWIEFPAKSKTTFWVKWNPGLWHRRSHGALGCS